MTTTTRPCAPGGGTHRRACCCDVIGYSLEGREGRLFSISAADTITQHHQRHLLDKPVTRAKTGSSEVRLHAALAAALRSTTSIVVSASTNFHRHLGRQAGGPGNSVSGAWKPDATVITARGQGRGLQNGLGAARQRSTNVDPSPPSRIKATPVSWVCAMTAPKIIRRNLIPD
jgi:hypothetical protein